MADTPMQNIRIAPNPLNIKLPDGNTVRSTHICDVEIPGLPYVLEGHIVPALNVASLIGIRILCKVGCRVVFTDTACYVKYNGKIILRGTKDPNTDLWVLPLTPKAIHANQMKLWTSQGIDVKISHNIQSRASPGIPSAPESPKIATSNKTVAMFTHSVRTRANTVKFGHQAMCNPKISSLLKALRKGFLKGCPNLSEELVIKYLNPSPATAKGHMKRPRKGIRSTRKNAKTKGGTVQSVPVPIPQVAPPVLPQYHEEPRPYPGPAYDARIERANIIPDDESIANVFCFGAFADKISGVVYNDLTGNFPFMSIDGSVCFFVLYHYELNAILVKAIANVDDRSIYEAYKEVFETLETKGYKPKMNVMDNQATKFIKKFLTKKECDLQVVEPHNHRVNAAERAIQTFKDAFIATLATTDRDFPLQLWDKLAPQVQDTLNLLRASRINPSISAYEALNGPYNWDRYPLAPPGCKAVIYEAPAVRGSWASRGTDAWYLGPSIDHYRCNLYFVPETRAYRISGSAELFPQHCQVPNLSPTAHLKALTEELQKETKLAAGTTKGRRLIKSLGKAIKAILAPPNEEEQRVSNEMVRESVTEDDAPIVTIQRITEAPAIMQTRDPTAKRNLINTARIHRRQTRNNTPGALPKITRDAPNCIEPDPQPPTTEKRRSTRVQKNTSNVIILPPHKILGGGTRASARLISQSALNAMTMHEALNVTLPFMPRRLAPPTYTDSTTYAHVAAPMIHPKTGEIISSYKRLMNDPATAEVWQTAFGKDFGGMAQGDLKTGQKGTNSVFVMTHKEIDIAKAAGHKWTYARIVVDHRPQKEDPNRIRIAVGGNLITYKGSTSTRTADLTTSKLLWNSVLSTKDAKYMCIDIKNFYLTAALDYYEYMKIPLALFPEWIKTQYNLNTHARDGFVFLEIRRAVWGLPQAGILANKLLRKRLKPHGYYECVNTPGLWRHATRPITFTLVVDDFGVKYVGKEHADHLIKCLQDETYKLTEDWTGNLYCGISLRWDYEKRHLDISMPGYIKKQLLKYEHIMRRIQHCPYSPEPKKYGAEAQSPLQQDNSQKLTEKEIKQVQKIVGSILYYARAVDMTVLMALSSIASEQTKGTKRTLEKAYQVLDYLASHPDAMVRFRASDMVLNIHSNASYLSEPNARSRACGHFFMGTLPIDGTPIKLNGAFHTLCAILRFVVASAAEAELGALFLNCQEGIIFRTTLEDLGHPQPKIPVHCDNATAVGIANNTIKRQRSRAMEMRYFWTCEKDAQKVYSFKWHPGMENLADYQSKHHPGAHHTAVRPYYLHEKNSPLELPRAIRPSTLKGCVGTLKDGYVRNVPLPRVPQRQSAKQIAPKTGLPIPGYLPVPSWIPTLPKLGSILGFSQRLL